MRMFRPATWVILAGLGSSAAAAPPQLVIEEPADRYLIFPRTPYDSTSPTRRVLIRNDGGPVFQQWIYFTGSFVVAATGGGFATGEEQYWDIACTPSFPEYPSLGFMDIDVCGATCDDEWVDSIMIECGAGLLDTPAPLVSLYAYRRETAYDAR
jgi:hypothetical protein